MYCLNKILGIIYTKMSSSHNSSTSGINVSELAHLHQFGAKIVYLPSKPGAVSKAKKQKASYIRHSNGRNVTYDGANFRLNCDMAVEMPYKRVANYGAGSSDMGTSCPSVYCVMKKESQAAEMYQLMKAIHCAGYTALNSGISKHIPEFETFGVNEVTVPSRTGKTTEYEVMVFTTDCYMTFEKFIESIPEDSPVNKVINELFDHDHVKEKEFMRGEGEEKIKGIVFGKFKKKLDDKPLISFNYSMNLPYKLEGSPSFRKRNTEPTEDQLNYKKWGIEVGVFVQEGDDTMPVLVEGRNWCNESGFVAAKSEKERSYFFGRGDLSYDIITCMPSGDNMKVSFRGRTYNYIDYAPETARSSDPSSNYEELDPVNPISFPKKRSKAASTGAAPAASSGSNQHSDEDGDVGIMNGSDY